MILFRAIFPVLLLICAVVPSAAQGPAMVPVQVEGTDTVPLFMLEDHTVDGVMSTKARRRQEKTDKLTRNVLKVYPYARVTAKLLAEYENDLAQIQKEHDKDLYVKLAEAELRAEFEEEVKNMTISQGRLLIKLIDRETGSTSYDLVKELRGGFQAWLWQGVARIFGNDLKDDYDPEGDDALVESVVRRIENGELVTAPRAARTEKAQARLEKRKARLFKKYGLAYGHVSAN
ncbi:MAG: DUF4294 domain-containing protein [Flavobacteriales bacterium]|nr:DUF4294 domain-containing protein [Flavobacteriales bacterium]MBL0036584.1 DUF4294 domain-containing protein [Flavobacteriales bacterium]